MNAAELARNPRLDQWFVRDLNKEPTGWAAADGSFDAVLCTAGLQYLQQPEAVLAEVRRVLKPGGIVIIAFSNRMFCDKVRGRLGRRSGQDAQAAAWTALSCHKPCLLLYSFSTLPPMTLTRPHTLHHALDPTTSPLPNPSAGHCGMAG